MRRDVGGPVSAMACLMVGLLLAPAGGIITGITLPGGFAVTEYYKGTVPNARSLALSGATPPAGYGPLVYIADNDGGKVYALIDSNEDGFAEDLVLVFDNMTVSNGVAWHEGSLYVSERSKLWRLGDVDAFVYANSNNASYPLANAQLLTDALPDAASHAAKYIAISPQGQLYINIGAPCNSCEPGGFQKNATTPTFQYGAIYKFNLSDFASPVLVASGVRNSVGFDWHPDTGEFWFTDNSRDSIGGGNETLTDNSPDDELNVVKHEGAFYGFPYCYTGASGGADEAPCARLAGIGDAIPDPELNPGEANMTCSGGYEWLQAPTGRSLWQYLGTMVRAALSSLTSVPGEASPVVTQVVPAIQALGPHVAALGMRFYRRNSSAQYAFPAAYDRTLFIAQRGSWNRQDRAGYRLVTVAFSNEDGSPQGAVPFMSGLLEGDVGEAECPDVPNSNEAAVRGRPVDVLQLPDGSLLVSDDTAGRVYKVLYAGRTPGIGGSGSVIPVAEASAVPATVTVG